MYCICRAEHDTLSYNHPAGLFGRQRTPSNLYLSMRDSTYNVDDRRYTVIADVKRNTGNVNMLPYHMYYYEYQYFAIKRQSFYNSLTTITILNWFQVNINRMEMQYLKLRKIILQIST